MAGAPSKPSSAAKVVLGTGLAAAVVGGLFAVFGGGKKSSTPTPSKPLGKGCGVCGR